MLPQNNYKIVSDLQLEALKNISESNKVYLKN